MEFFFMKQRTRFSHYWHVFNLHLFNKVTGGEWGMGGGRCCNKGLSYLAMEFHAIKIRQQKIFT